jgi:hypothetical protein
VNRGGIFCAAGVVIAGAIAGGILVSGQQIPEPRKAFGSSITGAFEGWYYTADGSRMWLLGYLNRNFGQALDVPIGPNNRIEPGGPDQGQPTHFLPGRNWGMFTVPVPRDFKDDQRLTWTITVNGQTMTIPLTLKPDYVVSPFSDAAVKNTPPVVKLDPAGPTVQGPIANVTAALPRTATVAAPLALNVWASDDMKYSSGSNAPQRNPPPAVTLTWSKYRGPGAVTFDKPKPELEKLTEGNAAFSGKAVANAKFSEPGEYMLHVTANDYSGSGGGGEVCCWTTILVKVAVKP